ncbi:hypothetical protein FQZ97_1213870 [compost metagenome]
MVVSTEVPALPSMSCRELMVPITSVGSVTTARLLLLALPWVASSVLARMPGVVATRSALPGRDWSI